MILSTGPQKYSSVENNVLISNFKIDRSLLTQFSPSGLRRYGFLSDKLAEKLEQYQKLHAEVEKERALYSSVTNPQEGFMLAFRAKEKARDDLYAEIMDLTKDHLAVTSYDASHSEV